MASISLDSVSQFVNDTRLVLQRTVASWFSMANSTLQQSRPYLSRVADRLHSGGVHLPEHQFLLEFLLYVVIADIIIRLLWKARLAFTSGSKYKDTQAPVSLVTVLDKPSQGNALRNDASSSATIDGHEGVQEVVFAVSQQQQLSKVLNQDPPDSANCVDYKESTILSSSTLPLPDTASHSVIMDQSLPPVDMSVLTATELSVFTDIPTPSASKTLPGTVVTHSKTPDAAETVAADANTAHVEFTFAIVEAPTEKADNNATQRFITPMPTIAASPCAGDLPTFSARPEHTATTNLEGGRGRGFIVSHEVIDLTDAKPDHGHALADQTNANVQTSDGPTTRLRSTIRTHTAVQPDWAVAPVDESDQPSRPVTRSASRGVRRNTVKEKRGKKLATTDATDFHAEKDKSAVSPSPKIIEVNGRWARGTWGARSRARG
ncbi:hypothetical protein BC835DRAFT_1349532 [Cytidiella melzeri]|nr:hypothetical protein BC835DRAFT_1349532 [Cytidiella melzeri]